MSRPPDEGPPNTRVEKLFDAQDERPTVNPPDPFSEPTRPDLKSPIPEAHRQTLRLSAEQQQEIERQVYAHEHKRLGEALEAIRRTLPQLVTTAQLEPLAKRVESIDHGIGVLIRADERLERKLDQLRTDLLLWLFGDTHRDGIAQEVGFTRVRVDSLFPMIEKLTKGVESAYDAALNTNGLEHESAAERSDAAGSGSGRPDR